MSGCLMCWTNQRVPRKTFQANGTSPRFSPFLNFSCLCHKVYALELRHWSVTTSENHFTIALTSEKLRPHFFYRSGKQSMFMGFYRPFFALIISSFWCKSRFLQHKCIFPQCNSISFFLMSTLVIILIVRETFFFNYVTGTKWFKMSHFSDGKAAARFARIHLGISSCC